ncbi:MAG: 50S ribosomal protein L25 [bacterium]
MRKDITVVAEPRLSRGKNEARRLRAAGKIPAILYGSRKDAVAVSVSPKEIIRILHGSTGHNTIFNVALNGETMPVMIVDWQFDPIKDTLLHVDLKRIDLTQRLQVHVPIVTFGEPKVVKAEGGLLEVVTRELFIECLPDEIPEHFALDVTDIGIGNSIRAADIPLTGSMQLLTAPDTVILHGVAIRGSVEAGTAAAMPEGAPAAPPEPEVLKKGKKEEEAAEEAKGKKK